MKKIGFIWLLGIALFCNSCEETEAPLDCSGDLLCTENFVSLIYSPEDAQDNAIILDVFYSQNLDNGNVYDFGNQNTANVDSTYVLITDAEIDEVKSSGTTIRFFGEADGQIVIEQDFVVGHDCCHVLLISGPGSEN